MIIRNIKDKNEYLVYGFYKADSRIYITYKDEYSPLNLIFEQDCEIIDNTPSKYWIKYDENIFLPEGWNDTNFLYELLDDLAPLESKKFKSAKEKIDEEFTSYFINDNTKYQDPNIKIEAEALGENWVLCPECDEAFEVDPNEGVVKCPNIACRELLNNPYAPKKPIAPKET